jgi:hypothetical protein
LTSSGTRETATTHGPLGDSRGSLKSSPARPVANQGNHEKEERMKHGQRVTAEGIRHEELNLDLLVEAVLLLLAEREPGGITEPQTSEGPNPSSPPPQEPAA